MSSSSSTPCCATSPTTACCGRGAGSTTGWRRGWLEDTTETTGRAEEYAAAIAEHYALAGDGDAAAMWYLRAGGRAMAVHALAEGDRLLGRGIDLASEANVRLRFDLLLARETVRHHLGDRAAQSADLDALEAMVDSVDDPTRQVELLLARSRFLFHASEYDVHASTAQRAVALARSADLDELEARALLSWGQGLTWKGSHDEANEVLSQALAAAREAELLRLEGETLRYLSIVANNRSEFARSLELLEAARAVHRADRDEDGESTILVQQASVLFNLERFAEARAALEQAVPLFEASGYRYRQAIAISNLASITLLQGELGLARRLVERGLELCRQIDDKEGIDTALNILGDLYRRAGSFSDAEALLTEALTLAVDMSFWSLASDSATHLALVAAAGGDLDRALELARQGASTAAQAESTLAAARASLVEGRIQLSRGLVDEAAALLDHALAAAEDLGLSTLTLEVQAARARAAWRAGHAEEAVALAASVLVEPGALEGSIDGGEVYRAAFEVLSAAGDGRAADALAAGARYVSEFAALVDEDDLRESFTDRVPAHAEMAAARG